MTLNKIYIALFLVFLLTSCNREKEEQLRNKERQLELREQKLIEIESDYQALLSLRDSLQRANALASNAALTAKTWPDSLQRTWNSKMVCTESDCNNYVIGDQRNEVWKFLSDSTGLYMNVVNNNKLVRVFRAHASEGKILLDYDADSTATSKLKIQIVLDDIRADLIKGSQTINGQKSCTARFSVELVPSAKK